MKTLSEQKGTSFDPRVVDVMERRYVELEAKVNSMET
jgi:HD-GYP domain-containing protein (c-di-GMP phosphodiesterase class II)